MTAKVKVNGIEKKFIVDTGSPISIMPADENILKKTEMQKKKRPVPRCQQKRSKIPKTDTNRHRIRKQQTENANINHRKK